MLNILSSNFSATIDIIALIVVLGFAVSGASKGFIKTFFSLFGTIIALLLAVLLASPTVEFLQNEHGVVTSIANGLPKTVSAIFGEEVLSMKISEVSESGLTALGVNGFVAKIIIAVQGSSYPLDTTISDVLCPTFGYYIALILSVVVLFILFKSIIAVLCSLMKKAHDNKIFAKYDKTLGLVLGLINGIVNLELIIMIISIIPLTFFQDIYLSIQLSTVAKFIENINLFGLIASAISQTKLLNMLNMLI